MKPVGPKYFARLAGIVPWWELTTANRRRLKVAVKPGLITVEPPEPSVGAVPLMLSSTMVPWVLQPNLFCAAVGWQLVGWAKHAAMVPQEAEWNFSTVPVTTENGKMTFALFMFRLGSTPSFSSSVLSLAPAAPWRVADVLTHGPGALRPSAPRKNDRVPEPFCGSIAAMVAWLPPELPGIAFHVLIVQLYMPVRSAVVRLCGAWVPGWVA